MATRDTHLKKAIFLWQLAQRRHLERRTEFITVNLIMYTVGHLIEALLAEENRHPACNARGVPHGDRDALMRTYLVGRKRLEPEWAERYADLVSRRDTFIDGGLPTPAFVDNYMDLAEPLVHRLQKLVDGTGEKRLSTVEVA